MKEMSAVTFDPEVATPNASFFLVTNEDSTECSRNDTTCYYAQSHKGTLAHYQLGPPCCLTFTLVLSITSSKFLESMART